MLRVLLNLLIFMKCWTFGVMKVAFFISFLLGSLLCHAGSAWKEVLSTGKGEVQVFYFNSNNFISDESGKLSGIEYELLELFFENVRSEYHIELVVNYIKAPSFHALYDTVRHGETGVFGACSFSITDKRLAEVGFSPKYMPDIEVMINSLDMPIVADTTEFLTNFANATALSVRNTTYEVDLNWLSSLVGNIKIENVQESSIIQKRLSTGERLFGYIELPNYFAALDNGAKIKRQNMFKVERDGYAIIYPIQSDWQSVVNIFFNKVRYKEQINILLRKYFGEDVNDLVWEIAKDQNGTSKEVRLLTREKELQQSELIDKELELQRESFVRNGLIAGVFIVLIVASLLFRQSKMKTEVNRLLRNKNDKIQLQSNLLEEKNKQITDSINYAQNIQNAIIPSESEVHELLPESFIFYRPKDVLSGDFYQVYNITTATGEKLTIFSVADCTGHGVPGALMSIVGSNYIKLAARTEEVNSPGAALDFLNEGVRLTFAKNGKANVKDGMDIALCAWNKTTSELYYSGAKNPVYVVRNRELIELKGDKHPIAPNVNEKDFPFTTKSMKVNKGDVVYLFSDGYADQFGGPKGKKFKYRPFKNLLIEMADDNMELQKEKLILTFDKWRGEHVQVDDVCVMGVRI